MSGHRSPCPAAYAGPIIACVCDVLILYKPPNWLGIKKHIAPHSTSFLASKQNITSSA